jgi:hypothetical protein
MSETNHRQTIERLTRERDKAIDALRLALPYLEQAAEPTQGYGYPISPDPRDFHPDEECCTPEEIANWKAACEAWERGDCKPVPPAHIPLSQASMEERAAAIAYFEEHTGKPVEGELRGHITKAPMGIGTYTVFDPEAVRVRDAALSALGERR